MEYKTELHCHCKAVSACARVEPERLVERYIEEGCTTLVLTDHMSDATYDPKVYHGKDDWQAKMDHFLAGFARAKAAAGDKIHVLLGVEVRLAIHSATDYLLYGVTEEFLRATPQLLDSDVSQFSKLVREAGILLVQAHPFRRNIIVTDPKYLDGVEVWNGNERAYSHNDIAEIWADRFRLIKTSGSDMHRESDEFAGGIITDCPITTNEELLAVLRTRSYRLIRAGHPGDDRIV